MQQKLKNLKGIVFLMLMAVLSFNSYGQGEKPSPPKIAEGEINGAQITINYGSPAVKGRQIWGDLVPLGEIWRAGANEATTFETSKEIKIQGKSLPAGKYSFFIIPGEYESVFVFNKVAKQWGAYSYDAAQDVLRVSVPSQLGSRFEERLVYEIKNDGFEIRWEYGRASAKVE